jgi:hypothetical protein
VRSFFDADRQTDGRDIDKRRFSTPKCPINRSESEDGEREERGEREKRIKKHREKENPTITLLF